MLCDALRDSLGIKRIISRVFGVSAEVADQMALLLQILLDGFFQLEAGVIRANGDFGLHDRDWPVELQARSLLDEFEQRREPLLDLIAASHINFQSAANRIADIVLVA